VPTWRDGLPDGTNWPRENEAPLQPIETAPQQNPPASQGRNDTGAIAFLAILIAAGVWLSVSKTQNPTTIQAPIIQATPVLLPNLCKEGCTNLPTVGCGTDPIKAIVMTDGRWLYFVPGHALLPILHFV